MKFYFSLLVICIIPITTPAQFSHLSIDFSAARDIVKDFKLKGNSNVPENQQSDAGNSSNQSNYQDSYNNLSDPSWQPYFESKPVTPKPLSQIQTELNRQLDNRKKRISKLQSRKEVFKIALEKLQSGEDYKTELEDWADESQQAQIDALLSVLSMLGDYAGPIQEAIDLHGFNTTYIHNALSGNANLEKLNTILNQYNKAEVKDLVAARDMLTKAMMSEVHLRKFFEHLQEFIETETRGAKALEYKRGLSEQHDLIRSVRYTVDFAVELLKEGVKDAGLEMTQKWAISQGMIKTAQWTSLAKFGVNYSYNSMKFWISWTSIDDILHRIDNTNSASNIFSGKIRETTDLIAALKTEVKELEAAKGDDETGRKVLNKIRQKELYNAYLAGDYYSQRTGVYAPGHPINTK